MEATIASKPVRVSIPASVAADIGMYKKAVGSILDKLGCQACCSGHDIFFELQREVVLPRSLKDAAIPSMIRNVNRDVVSVPTVRAGLKPELSYEIENVYAAIDRIAELSGHTACATGCDMLLELETRFVVDTKLNIEEQVMSFG